MGREDMNGRMVVTMKVIFQMAIDKVKEFFTSLMAVSTKVTHLLS